MIVGPVPRQHGDPLLRVVLWLGVAASLCVVYLITRVPGPRPAPLFTQVVVVHDALLPARVTAEAPIARGEALVPVLRGGQSSIVDDRRMDSWLCSYGRERITIHRIEGLEDLPRNAQRLALETGPGSAFEVGDLTLVSWASGDRLLVVAGSAGVLQLREVADWLRAEPARLDAPAVPGPGH